jgi:hypothetical protein
MGVQHMRPFALGMAALLAPMAFITNASAHEHEAEHRLETLVSYFADGAVVGEPSIVD